MSTNINYGVAQAQFIKSIRQSIDADQGLFFQDKDWRMLTVKGGRYVGLGHSRVDTNSFYVKPVAAWVPHLLIPGHVPCCPKCKHSRSVDCSKAIWIPTPKILYGLSGHRYLDTKSYPCAGCGGRFAGYNIDSMIADGNKLMGFFFFNVSRQFAIDDELFNEIMNSGEETTSTIYRRLSQNIKDRYFADFQYYLFAVRNNQVVVAASSRNTTPHDSSQATLDKHLQPIQNESEQQRLAKNLKTLWQKKKYKSATAEAAMNDDIDFKRLLKVKMIRNERLTLLPKLGVSKLKRLMDEKIMNAKQLLQFEDTSGKFRDKSGRSTLEIWKRVVENEYKIREMALKVAQAEAWEAELIWQNAAAALESDTSVNNSQVIVTVEHCEPKLPPMFSAMTDPNGYNARFLSMARTDSILMTEYQHRKPVQVGKMLGLTAEILKIDFNYKIAKKIRVWNGRGISFRPYKCLVTVQNEDGLTVLWKALHGSESFNVIK